MHDHTLAPTLGYLDYLESGDSEQSSAVVSLHKVSMTRHVSARAQAHRHGNLEKTLYFVQQRDLISGE